MPFLPFIPFADVADSVIAFTLQGRAALLTLAFKCTTAISAPDLINLNLALENWWSTDLAPLCSNQLAADYIKSTDLTTAVGPTQTLSPISPATGGSASAPAAAQVALGVTFATALRGRSYRGRNYVPGIPEAALASVGSWAGPTLAAIDIAYQNLNGRVSVANFSHVVCSRYNNSVRRTVGVATAVLSYRANARVVTQRRRIT